MMRRYRASTARWVVGSVVVALAAFTPALSDTNSGTTFGFRTGVYTEQSAGFLGGEVLTPLGASWYFNPNLEVALVSSDNDIVTVNGDFHYDFFQDRPYWVWAGGGPAFIHREVPGAADDNDFGMNFLGGIGWKTTSKVSPYLQAKVTLSNEDEGVLAFGLRF
jgi:hypothetical protein